MLEVFTAESVGENAPQNRSARDEVLKLIQISAIVKSSHNILSQSQVHTIPWLDCNFSAPPNKWRGAEVKEGP